MDPPRKQLVTMVTDDPKMMTYTTTACNGDVTSDLDPLASGSPTVTSTRGSQGHRNSSLLYDVENCSGGRPLTAVEFKQKAWWRLRSNLELYLAALCLLLFLACIGFVVIAFTRDGLTRKGERKWAVTFPVYEVPGASTGGGNCSSGSSRLNRLGVSQAQKAKVSGDGRPRLRAP